MWLLSCEAAAGCLDGREWIFSVWLGWLVEGLLVSLLGSVVDS